MGRGEGGGGQGVLPVPIAPSPPSNPPPGPIYTQIINTEYSVPLPGGGQARGRVGMQRGGLWASMEPGGQKQRKEPSVLRQRPPPHREGSEHSSMSVGREGLGLRGDWDWD